jgi:hypothetical protein
MLSRQTLVLAAVLLPTVAGTVLVLRSKPAEATIAFWFDAVSDDTLRTVPERLGGGIVAAELKTIESIAIGEITDAFREFRITLTTADVATYRVRVVDSLSLPFAPRAPGPSAESRSIPGLRGQGAVNFRLMAHNAIAFAPPDADRSAMIAGIGRGIGRAAVHEFAHQMLGSTPIHDTTDVRSYEYRTASRAEQYYGDMHWDVARPLIERRVGRR